MGGRKDDVTRPPKPSRNRPLSAVLEEFEVDDHDHKGSVIHLHINDNNKHNENNNNNNNINRIDENDVNANEQDSSCCQSPSMSPSSSSSSFQAEDPPAQRPGDEGIVPTARSPCSCSPATSTKSPLSNHVSSDTATAVNGQDNLNSSCSSRQGSLKNSGTGSPKTPRRGLIGGRGGSGLNGMKGGLSLIEWEGGLSGRRSGLNGKEGGLSGRGRGQNEEEGGLSKGGIGLNGVGSELNERVSDLSGEGGGSNREGSGLRGKEGGADSKEGSDLKEGAGSECSAAGEGSGGAGGEGAEAPLEGGKNKECSPAPSPTLSRSGSFKRPDSFKTGRRQALTPPTLLSSPTSSAAAARLPRNPAVNVVIHTASDDDSNDEDYDDEADMARLKQATARLHLTTRRYSTMQWKARYVERPQFPVAARDGGNGGQNGDSDAAEGREAGRWTAERTQRINTALDWIKNELMEMRAQDQSLARQLLTIRSDLHQVKLARSCEEHRDMLDDVQSELEELQEFADVLDLPIHTINDSPLQHLGVTRMNFSARRFSTC